MMRALIIGAAALGLSASAASAQTVYVSPGYGVPAYVAPAPAYVAPPPAYVAPPVVRGYYYPGPSVTVAAPVYDYAPAYPGAITIDDYAD
jgi:hypothetical protein